MDYIYKKSSTIFNAHSYWTKQPTNVIEDFIDKNSKEGDVVLDPFCGSGMTGVACIAKNRNFILSDISPTCVHISKGYCTKYQYDNIDKIVDSIVKNIEPLYYSICPECGKLFEIDYSILEDKLQKNGKLELQFIVGHCPNCKIKIKKKPDENDLIKLNAEEYKNYYFPKDAFFGQEPKRNYKRGIYKVYQLYSKRNLSALSILLSNIEQINNENQKKLLLFAFTSILFNCSLLSRYNPKYENTQIKMGTYYIPQFIKDNNVILSFKRKIKKIIAANKEIFKQNPNIVEDIRIADATELKFIKDNSIDYIYTDPPYSDKISYAELNLVYESWLNEKKTDVTKEMIVSKTNNKTIDTYSAMFEKFIQQAKRVLKNNKNITIIFHNSSIEHWSYFQNIINTTSLRPIINDNPVRLISSAKTTTQYQTEKDSQCFLAFTLTKDINYANKSLEELNENDYKLLIEKLRKEAIKNNYNSKSDQFDYIINKLLFQYKIKSNIYI